MAANAIDWLVTVLQGLAFLALAPLVAGVLRWSQARLQRRQGPSILQYYRDLAKLSRKRPVIPDSASPLFLVAPIVVFTGYALPAFLMPVFYLPASEAGAGADLLLLVFLLGVARFALALAGLDSGAPFGGLGSSRELILHVLIEPALIMAAVALALEWHTTDLHSLLAAMRDSIASREGCEGWINFYTAPSHLFLLLALLLIALAEAGRLPFDNPATHLELTMFGKAILLEYSGRYLALLEWAEAIRLTFFFALLCNLLAPQALAAAGEPIARNAVLMMLRLFTFLLLAIVLAFWESFQIKRRLRAVRTPALIALGLALLAAVFALIPTCWRF